jgi:hypothetical protein
VSCKSKSLALLWSSFKLWNSPPKSALLASDFAAEAGALGGLLRRDAARRRSGVTAVFS